MIEKDRSGSDLPVDYPAISLYGTMNGRQHSIHMCRRPAARSGPVPLTALRIRFGRGNSVWSQMMLSILYNSHI